MAVQAWTDMSILLGGYDMACRATGMNLDVTAQELETTTLCVSDGHTTRIAGLRQVAFNADLLQDYDADQVDEELGLDGGTLTVSTPLTVLPAGTDYGAVGYTFRANQFAYEQMAPVDGLATARVSGKARRGPAVRGTVLHPPSTSRTSTGDGTGAQIGAVSATQTLYAALHVTSASGSSPTLDVVIESDDNAGFTSPTTRITFAQAGTQSWQWSSVAGAITDDYWRITYTLGGGSPDFQFCVVAGIAST